ncbi:Cochaperone protein [Phlyctochytrium planicorne]|nr:Cochaperone protein [Phlyctochytrium planicorne]
MVASLELYTEANAAYVDEDYDHALLLFTKLINADPSSADYYLKRSLTYAKLQRFQESLDDATAAVMMSGGNNDVAAKANFRKGVAAFELKKMQVALEAFTEAKKVGSKEKQLDAWIKKAQDALPPSATKTQSPSTTTSASSSAPAAIPPAAPYLPPAKIRHEWFQNENFVTISVFIKQTKKEDVTIDYAARAISVTVKLPGGSDYMLELDPLAHAIVPGESKHSILGSKIEIKLKKEMVGVKWGTLEGEDSGILQTMVGPEGDKPVYPSSSKKNTNWDAVAKSVDEEKPEGEAALNALFQQIYKDANEDTRRAMMKSYVESNGTCLSTNWAEVGKGRVETTPPEGMIAKKFDI